MKRRTRRVLATGAVVCVLLALLLGPKLATMMADMAAMKAPRYETGPTSGPELCATCHPAQYAAWKDHSRHARATTAETVKTVRAKLVAEPVLNFMMGGEMCDACHGPPQSATGVDCEICHGTAPPDQVLTEVHRSKFTPGLAKMRQSGFCGKCHDIEGTDIMSVFTEWQASPAGRAGVSCQDCHMAKTGGVSDHRFATAVLDTGIYEDDLALTQAHLGDGKLAVTVVNRVTGHSVPVGGPTRWLVLTATYADAAGNEAGTARTAFGKTSELMAGLLPMELTENSQLKAGESREVSLPLPQGNVAAARLTLHFAEVSDEHNGDLEQAHWVGPVVVDERVGLERH